MKPKTVKVVAIKIKKVKANKERVKQRKNKQEYDEVVYFLLDNETELHLKNKDIRDYIEKICETEDKKYPPVKGFQGRKMFLRYIGVLCK